MAHVPGRVVNEQRLRSSETTCCLLSALRDSSSVASERAIPGEVVSSPALVAALVSPLLVVAPRPSVSPGTPRAVTCHVSLPVTAVAPETGARGAEATPTPARHASGRRPPRGPEASRLLWVLVLLVRATSSQMIQRSTHIASVYT